MPVLSAVRAQRGRTVGFGLLGAGAVSVVIGWISVSGAPTPWEQLSYLISGGLAGLLCLGLGVTVLLATGLTDEQRKLAELAELTAGPSPAPDRSAATTAGLRPWPVLAGAALSVVLLVVGWNEAAVASNERDAVPGLAIGVAALLVTAAFSGAHLVRLRVALQRTKADVLRPLAERYRGAVGDDDAFDLTVTGGGGAGPTLAPGGTVLVAPGLTRFHRSGCPTLTELQPATIARADLDPALRPCQICEVAITAGGPGQ